MIRCTRRDLFKTGLAVAATAAAPPVALGAGVAASVSEVGNPAATANDRSGPSPRQRLLLDFGWHFHFGHATDPAKDFGFDGGGFGTFAKAGNLVRAARLSYDDSEWQPVDLPHDWAVELPFENARPLADRGFHPLGREYPASSIGWYRRVFEIPAEDAGKRISIEFDGVFRQAMVIFNGHYLGENFSGYAPFSFDVSDYTNVGGSNSLLVRVDASLSEGWFYEGAGIYRHVWLVKTDPVHVAQWGAFVQSEVRPGVAALSIQTEVNNHSGEAKSCRVISTVLDAAGQVAGTAASAPASISAWNRRQYLQQVEVKRPVLWSLEQPNLYKLVTEVEAAGSVVDRYETAFGIRTCVFDADKGFFLNGQPVKIKGTCNHQDHAGLGVALPDRIQYYRIEKLKEMGSNGYRTSHNPPTPELLDACDRLGMLAMDETRMMSSAPEGLSQLERLIRRDRNHPSVVIWSLANEEPEQGTQRGENIVASMKALAKSLDPSSPVTTAMNGAWGKGVSNVVDVQGLNYHEKGIDGFHKEFPAKPMIGTETGSTVSTRGIYQNDKERGYVSAYDRNYPPWAATAETWWTTYDDRPFLAGGFAWTGFDYRGEPTPYQWPCINSHFGIMDTCGFPKDNYFYYQAWWGSKPVLHLFPHWNWEGKEGQEIEVWVHSNLDRVELFLNGQSLGAQDVKKDSHLAWKVKYAPGTLEARGSKNGRQLLTAKRETTGPAARLVLRPDRQEISADGEDVSMVAVEVQDARGRMVPAADNEVSFQVSGGGRLIGVGNGNPSSHEPDKARKRAAFNGLCMGIVQAGKQAGELVVEASSPGLEPANVSIRCTTATLRPAVALWQPPPPVTGPGIVGTWRSGGGDIGVTTFVFQRDGNSLTGLFENDFMGDGDIENGKIDGDNVSFTAGMASLSGKMAGDEMTVNVKVVGTEGDGGTGMQISPLTLKKVTK